MHTYEQKQTKLGTKNQTPKTRQIFFKQPNKKNNLKVFFFILEKKIVLDHLMWDLVHSVVTSNVLINFNSTLNQDNRIVWLGTVPQIPYYDILIIISYDNAIVPSETKIFARLNFVIYKYLVLINPYRTKFKQIHFRSIFQWKTCENFLISEKTAFQFQESYRRSISHFNWPDFGIITCHMKFKCHNTVPAV